MSPAGAVIDIAPAQPTAALSELIGAREAAALADMSLSTWYRRVADGDIPSWTQHQLTYGQKRDARWIRRQLVHFLRGGTTPATLPLTSPP